MLWPEQVDVERFHLVEHVRVIDWPCVIPKQNVNLERTHLPAPPASSVPYVVLNVGTHGQVATNGALPRPHFGHCQPALIRTFVRSSQIIDQTLHPLYWHGMEVFGQIILVSFSEVGVQARHAYGQVSASFPNNRSEHSDSARLRHPMQSCRRSAR